jgi:LmbE family N-acetylglucosaminyl deacetylase
MLRLLCVTAHPDDESAGFGGTLLQTRERGMETFVLCLTPGEAATHRGKAATDEALREMRRKEFAAACEHLRVTEGRVLEFPDGKLDRQNFFDVVGELSRWIRQLRPQVIVTFGPEGGLTAHPDHSMASLYTAAAFQWAARSNRFTDQFYEGRKPYQAQKLYYSTAEFNIKERQPVSLAPITTSIDIAPYFERKIEAFKMHESQAPLFDLFETQLRPRGARELFHLAASSTPRKIKKMETDLWDGVEDL